MSRSRSSLPHFKLIIPTHHYHQSTRLIHHHHQLLASNHGHHTKNHSHLSFLPSNRALELRMSIDPHPTSSSSSSSASTSLSTSTTTSSSSTSSPSKFSKSTSSSFPTIKSRPPFNYHHPTTMDYSNHASSNNHQDHSHQHDPIGQIRETLDKPLMRNSSRREDNFSIRCTHIDQNGQILGSRSMSKSEICTQNRLQPRDLRKIDSRISNVVPSILVRDEAIIFNVLNIRALIKTDSIIIFEDPNSPSLIVHNKSSQQDSSIHQSSISQQKQQSQPSSSSSNSDKSFKSSNKSNSTNYSIRSAFLHNLLNNLRDHHPSSSSYHHHHHQNCENIQAHELPYEFRALETMLGSVATSLESELGVLKTLVLSLLDGLEQNIEREKLKQLLLYSRRLTNFNGRALLVQRCLDEILENEQDMANAYLSQKKLTNLPRESHDHEELEQILESFSKYVEEIVHEGTSTLTNIKNTEEIIDLILDSNRNTLLALDLKVSIATMGLGIGALTAGLFGMNLRTHLEDDKYAFYIVSGITIVTVGISIGYGCRRLYRLRRVGLSSLNTSNYHQPSSSLTRKFGSYSNYNHHNTRSSIHSRPNPIDHHHHGAGGILDWDMPKPNPTPFSLTTRIKNRLFGLGHPRTFSSFPLSRTISNHLPSHVLRS